MVSSPKSVPGRQGSVTRCCADFPRNDRRSLRTDSCPVSLLIGKVRQRRASGGTHFGRIWPCMRTLVLGATGVVGSLIADALVASGEHPYALSRRQQGPTKGITWLQGDLREPRSLKLPTPEIIYSTVHPILLSNALAQSELRQAKRVIFFSSTSILTKLNSDDLLERANVRQLAQGELCLQMACEALGVSWTALRPTLIYSEERDANLTRVANFVRRFGFFPLHGRGKGLRQPVSAADLALGAILAAASPQTSNKTYVLPGAETVSYREMIGRVFDGLGRKRLIIPLPPFAWMIGYKALRHLFPMTNAGMGSRMAKDMTFDGSKAFRDFGWSPQPFRPRFND